MAQARKIEAELLAAEIRKLKDKGYDVILEPSGDFLPEPLRHYRADAIAIGRDPHLVVEVVSNRDEDRERATQLQKSLAHIDNWKLHLVFYSRDESVGLPRSSDAELLLVLRNAARLAEIDPRAALIACWASFEALARQRRPTLFARAQSPGRIVEMLASEGAVMPQEADMLRSLAAKRNAFVHGDFSRLVTIDEVTGFIGLIHDLHDGLTLWPETTD